MKGYGKIAAQILNLLRIHPRGMTITDISRTLALNRNSVAKYLEILVISGQVDKERIGRAKLFFLSQRVPLSAMLNLSSDLILVLDGEGRIWYMNENLLAFEEKHREDLIGRTPGDAGLEILQDPGILACLEGPLKAEFRKEIQVSRGEEHLFFTLSLVPTTFEDGSGGITIIAGDITERKRAEGALIGSERRYRSLFENMMDGYVYARVLFVEGQASDLLYLDVNPAFGEITGLRDVIGRRVTEVIPGIQETNPEIFEIYQRVVTTGRPERYETYIGQLNARYSVAVFSPEKDHIVAVFEDITDRKRAEEELTENLHLFQALLDSLPVPVYYKDPMGRILGYNRALEEFSGRALADIRGKIARDILPPDLSRQIEDLESAALSTGRTRQLRIRVPRTEGGWRDILVFKTPFRKGDGSWGGTVATVIDTKGLEEKGS